MEIFYRVSPYLSTNPNPLGRDKKHIVYECFKSFKKALTGQKVTILSDHVPTDWYELFKGYPVITSPQGNIESFHKQLDLVCKLPNEEKVMLVEDDYLWIPGSIGVIEKALDTFTIMSPYDHPAHYQEERFKHQAKRMILVDNQTYREAPSNTLTFATHAWVIKQNIDIIKSFGVRDHELFMTLEHDMFVPVPSLATHLVEGLLAPNRKMSDYGYKNN